MACPKPSLWAADNLFSYRLLNLCNPEFTDRFPHPTNFSLAYTYPPPARKQIAVPPHHGPLAHTDVHARERACADAYAHTSAAKQQATFPVSEISIASLRSVLVSVQVVRSRQQSKLQNTFDQNAIYFWVLSSLRHTEFAARCLLNWINTRMFQEYEKPFLLPPSASLLPSFPSISAVHVETLQARLHWNSLELAESNRQFSELHSITLVWSALVRNYLPEPCLSHSHQPCMSEPSSTGWLVIIFYYAALSALILWK